MKKNTNAVVDAVSEINHSGNLVNPLWAHWLKAHLGGQTSTAIAVALNVLSDIVYWYRPAVIRDEQTGAIKETRKRFQADKLQRSYDAIAEQWALTKRQAKNAVKLLVDAGVITIEFRTVIVKDTKLCNVLFIEPVPAVLRQWSEGYPQNEKEVLPKLGIPSNQNVEYPPTNIGETNTKTSHSKNMNTEDSTATTSQSEGSGRDAPSLASQESKKAVNEEARKIAERIVATLKDCGLQVTVSSTLVKACAGKTVENALINALAVVEKSEIQPIRQPQGALTKALQDNWAPSAVFFRNGLTDYGRRIYVTEFLKAARALDHIAKYGFRDDDYAWITPDGVQHVSTFDALPFINDNECGLGVLWEELKYLNAVA